MKRPRKWQIVILFTGILTLSWVVFSSQTVGTRIKKAFPGSAPQVSRFNSDDIYYDDLIRIVVPSFFRQGEQMGMELTDAAEPLDLEARFSQLNGIHFTGVRFVRCKIIRLPEQPRGLMLFDDCDFSELSINQKNLLRPYDSGNPKYKGTFAYDTV